MKEGNEISVLYQETILDHGKNPRNFCRKVSDGVCCTNHSGMKQSTSNGVSSQRDDCCNVRTCFGKGSNPMCGDRIEVCASIDLQIPKNPIIRKCCFSGEGCLICMASASIMTEMITAKSLGYAESLFNSFRAFVMDGVTNGVDVGKLIIFSGVRKFPIRIKCVMLPWHALMLAIPR